MEIPPEDESNESLITVKAGTIQDSETDTSYIKSLRHKSLAENPNDPSRVLSAKHPPSPQTSVKSTSSALNKSIASFRTPTTESSQPSAHRPVITSTGSYQAPESTIQGSSNLANLATIDHAFFNQQQQLRAEQRQKMQQQQQQQQTQQLNQLSRPIGSPSSNTSTECLTSDRASTASNSTSTSSASSQQSSQPQPSPRPLGTNLLSRLPATETSPESTTGSQQKQITQVVESQSGGAGASTGQMQTIPKSDTIDDIQSLGSQFNICLTTSQSQQDSSSITGSINLHQLQPFIQGHGHYFTKKTFHKPTYCHHCADMLWGLIGQGYICDVCNFVVHERCMKTVVSSCSTVASSNIKNPMPHCWTDTHAKRKFCNVCRKKIEDNVNAIRCSVCEYCVHIECQEFSISDCRECATYVPDQILSDVMQQHHWREGNLPQTGSKCYWCKKSCFSAECLTGMRCEWCQMTVHASCLKNAPRECNLGSLQSIMLPPYCVSIPRTDVPMETIIGVSTRFNYALSSLGDRALISGGPASRRDNLTPRSTSEDFCGQPMSSVASNLYHHQLLLQQQQQQLQLQENDLLSRDKDEELLRVYDGNSSLKKRSFRLISVHRSTTRENLIAACLRAFYIHDDFNHYTLVDIGDNDRELDDPFPLMTAIGRRIAGVVGGVTSDRSYPSQRVVPISVQLRYRPPDSSMGFIRVYPGRLNVTELTYCSVPVTSDTSVSDIMKEALDKFRLRTNDLNRYRLVEVSLDKGSSVHERTMDNQECPWEIIKNVARESVRQKENTRFYLQQQDEVYCSSVAIFVGNLPCNLSQKQYESMIMDQLGKPYRFKQINPIYYEYGSCIITYDNADIAVKAFYMLRESVIKFGEEIRMPVVLLLPNIVPEMIPDGVRVNMSSSCFSVTI